MSDVGDGDPAPGDGVAAPLPPRLGGVALELWALAESRKLARELAGEGIRAVQLSGPEIASRLGLSRSARLWEERILIEPAEERRLAAAMARSGWTTASTHGTGRSRLERDGFVVEILRRLPTTGLSDRQRAMLERDLRDRAERVSGGGLVASAESLLLLLLADEPHAEPEAVEACAAHVADREHVRRLARDLGIGSASEEVLGSERGRAGGSTAETGPAVSAASRPFGSFVTAVREALDLRREGFGLVGSRSARMVDFAGLPVRVPDGVFAPTRMSEAVLGLAADVREGAAPGYVVDVGTGSGAIALALARRWPRDRVVGIDVSHRAVRCARRNAARLGIANARFVVGSLLEPAPAAWRGRVSLVTSSLPFVPPAGAGEVRRAQVPALTSIGPGVDGLGLVRALLAESSSWLAPGGSLVLQLSWQWDDLVRSIVAEGYHVAERRTHLSATIGHLVRDEPPR